MQPARRVCTNRLPKSDKFSWIQTIPSFATKSKLNCDIGKVLVLKKSPSRVPHHSHWLAGLVLWWEDLLNIVCAQPKPSLDLCSCGLPHNRTTRNFFVRPCTLIKSDIKCDTQRLWWSSAEKSVALACKYAQSKSHARACGSLVIWCSFLLRWKRGFFYSCKIEWIRTKER